MDIDVNVTGMNFEKDTLISIISNIIMIDLEDNVLFDIDKTTPIKEDNEYGGYKFKLIAKLSNIRVPFSIDISTGDLITPRAIEYTYKTILEKEDISLYTYNYETIIAEKLETILKRNTANSRMKDYYDLYYFVNYKWNELNKENLNLAIKTTFNHRHSEKYLSDYKSIITNIQKDKLLEERWKNYKKEHEYAKDIQFEEVISSIYEIICLL